MAKKTRKKKSPVLGEVAPAGLILICDIVEFSQMEQPDQARAVMRLLEFLESHELLKPRFGGEMNGTGDGALIAWSQRNKSIEHGQAIEFAEGLLAHMRGARPRPIELRIGIHIGQFRTVSPTYKRLGVQLVGTGLNEAARVSSLGDGGHIIVSEAFTRHWRDAGRFPTEEFFPNGHDPIVAFVKHNEALGVRVYVGNGLAVGLPDRLRRLLCVDQLLELTLKEIETGLVGVLVGELAAAGKIDDAEDSQHADDLCRKLSARISIFSPSRAKNRGQRLCPTDYRHHQEPLLRGKGKTEYSISGAKPEGPLARAFQSNDVQVLHRLPADINAYCNALAEHGVGRDKITGMSRRARSYISFPFGFRYPPDQLNSPTQTKPEGVVCIDIDDPLDEFETQRLRHCAHKLAQYFNTVLSALWRLRTN